MAADRLKEIVDGKVKIDGSTTLLDDSPVVRFNKLSANKTGLKLPAGAIFMD